MIAKILHYFNLDSELEDFDKIHETIEKDIVFKGTNLWILMFAIVIASVGLNMNSTAVIIGAMLISPLMGPINGMGYSIATYNFVLFRRSFKNFSFAVLASLAASTLYFAISPLSNAHSELLARTSPTIYDVIIALFGGLAGIVAMSTKQKGNVIPGVAIATALMPPLCTAGYGLATANFPFFFGAIYLFTINTVFIGISSVIISQILKFPIRTIVGDLQKKIVDRWITVVILLTLIPSIYFGYLLVQKDRFVENTTRFSRNVSVIEGAYLLKHEIDADKRIITLTYGGNPLTDEIKKHIKERAKDFSLQKADLHFQQGMTFTNGDNASHDSKHLQSELERMNVLLRLNRAEKDSIDRLNKLGKQLLGEVKTLYPQVMSCIYTEAYLYEEGNKPKKQSIVLIGLKGKALRADERAKLVSWLKLRLQKNQIKLVVED